MNDFLIGYHFKHLNSPKTLSKHTERVAEFWNLHLLGYVEDKGHLPFKLIDAHVPLKIKPGEVGRWEILFYEVLKEHCTDPELEEEWKSKIKLFKEQLINHKKIKESLNNST